MVHCGALPPSLPLPLSLCLCLSLALSLCVISVSPCDIETVDGAALSPLEFAQRYVRGSVPVRDLASLSLSLSLS
eukprot:COSAG03_NODE_6162_length_1104_cov_1.226866_2_plen_74_part_01